jgi:hypothetical protein
VTRDPEVWLPVLRAVLAAWSGLGMVFGIGAVAALVLAMAP